ncbi:MAG: ECF subfamily RNA polymerase sigma factor, BldN family, partial [Stackebrandtia sp.]
MPGTIPVINAVTATQEMRDARDTLRGGFGNLRQMLTVDLDSGKTRASRHRRVSDGDGAVTGAGSTGDRRQPAPEQRSEEAGPAEVRRLVAQAQDGDVEAFGSIYDRYNETVFRYIYFRV